MNKKILTRVLSFVLVLCLLVPVIPNLGFDFLGVKASAASLPTDAIYFKAGSSNYWSGSAKVTTSYEVLNVNGVTYLPVAIIAAAYGTDAATLKADAEFAACVNESKVADHIEVVHGKQIYTGYYTYVSNMNLVAVSTSATDVFSGVTDDQQVALMKQFIFDNVDYSGNKVSAVTEENLPSDHPFLLADQDQFDKLHNVYNGTDTSDPVLKSYLDYIVNNYQGLYRNFANSADDGSYESFNSTAGLSEGQTSMYTIPFPDGNGYDVGGRLGQSASNAANVMHLAYLYQVTREEKYAKLAFDYAIALCQWEHWGAGHTLNAADAGYYMALAYDWCYDVWENYSHTYNDVEYTRNTIRDALLTKVVYAGIRDEQFTYPCKKNFFGSTTNVTFANPWPNSVLGTIEPYGTRTNNWNGVCSSGMIMAALAIGHETGDVSNLTIKPEVESDATQTILSWTYTYNGSYDTTVKMTDKIDCGTTYQSLALYLINRDLYNLEKNGLGQYVPDGSYIESAAYWSYGTNSIFRTVASLQTACGTDFGLSAAWGLDRTGYYANYVQSSDGDVWRYHDHSGSDSSMDTSMNMLYGAVIGDGNLVGYRKYLIEKGASTAEVFDTLKYDADVTGFGAMDLDYYMQGVQGYTVRDSWESEGIYAGFMGGPNNVSHGQLDSGAFVYYNNGTMWFQDVGTENYNAYGFGYGTNVTTFVYYPSTSEGNNVLVNTGLTYGQEHDASANITKYGSNKHGSYAVLDQTAVYGATSAQRGILLTNDRKTFVVQDEITLSSAQTLYWFGHLLDSIQIDISADGRTAYLFDGNSTIRCTLVSTDSSLAFSEMDCAYADGNMVLDYTTEDLYYSVNLGGQQQNDYSGWHKLAIKCSAKASTALKFAVVIEEIAPGDSTPVGYTLDNWVDMASWSDATVISSDDSAYDNKVLLDKNFDQSGTGTFSANGGNFRILNVLEGADNVIYAMPTASTASANITLAAAEGKVASSSIGNGMLITEFDIKTANVASGEVTFALYGTDIYPIVTFDLYDLNSCTDWTHITLVLDEATNIMYLYAGETLVKSVSYASKSYQKLKLVVSSKEGALASSDAYFMLDNVVIRTFTETYTELDGVLSGSSSITDWADREVQSEESVEATGRIARLYNAAANADGTEDDLPVVDLWGDISVASELDAQGVVTYSDSDEEVYVDSFADLAAEINTGAYTNAELYAGNINPIEITKKIIVDTNGHDFYATSPNLICQISGEKHTFKVGTVTVSLIINGNTRILSYTSTDYLSYEVSSDQLGKLYEVDNGDGTYRYIATEQGAWALTKNGSPIMNRKLLIVTSKNNRFYLSGYDYDGCYVIVDANGNVTAGGDPSDFYLTTIKNSYHKISITNDFYYDSSDDGVYGNNTANNNIYLNGHTISYYSNDTAVGDHMFTLGESNLNIYGPGTIDNSSPAAKIVMKGSYSATATKFENVTINANAMITDLRTGTIEFNNCTINMRANKHAVGVENRRVVNNDLGSQANGVTDVTEMPKLKINGGVINAPYNTGNNGAIQVRDNAMLEIYGGLQINCPGANGAIYLYMSDQIRDNGVSDAYEVSVENMYVHIGEIYCDNPNLFCYFDQQKANAAEEEGTEVSDADNMAVFLDKPKYIAGAGFAQASDAVYPCADGYVLAKTGDAGYAYKVVATIDSATVTWSGANITETWVAGVTPTMSEEVKTYLRNNVAAKDGYLRTYSIDTLASGGTHTFTPIYMPDLSIKMGMALYTQFNITISIEAHSDINYFVVNGTKYEKADAALVDGYYVIEINDVAPSAANDLISIIVNAQSSDGTAQNITATTSIVNYAAQIMAGTKSDETKKLMSTIVDYAGACSAYEGNTYDNASCQVVLDRYSEYRSYTELLSQAPETSAVKGAIKSAYLDLGGAPAYVFRFNESFTGTVTLTYTAMDLDDPKTVTLNVVDGQYDGSDTYKLVLKAYDMATDINISVQSDEISGSAVYNLNVYYTQAVQSAGVLYDLLVALNAYSEASKVYKASV